MKMKFKLIFLVVTVIFLALTLYNIHTRAEMVKKLTAEEKLDSILAKQDEILGKLDKIIEELTRIKVRVSRNI